VRERERPLDGTSHGAITSPLLGVGQMSHGIQVRGDEFAARILIDTQLHTQQTHYCAY